MTSPLIGRNAAEIPRHAKSELSRLKLILMMAIAASKAAASPSHHKRACKPRANCLKPKEIWKIAQPAARSVLTCGTP
jgi:hypothetical protein